MRTQIGIDELEVRCNCCGKKLKVNKDIVLEGVLDVVADWGYFSQKDGEIHKFDICESCYDEMVKMFKLPIEVVSKTEML